MQTRVSTIAEIVSSDDNQLQHQIIAIKRLPSKKESDAVLAIPEISFLRTVRHPAIAEAYAKCESMPALEIVGQNKILLGTCLVPCEILTA